MALNSTCECCNGSGVCPDCHTRSRFVGRALTQRFCPKCFGTGRCERCEDDTIPALPQTFAETWRQAVVQDGLF